MFFRNPSRTVMFEPMPALGADTVSCARGHDARMGYETVSTHTVFIEKRFLEGH